MEYQETVTPAPTLEKPLETDNEELERQYEFSLNNDSYLVTMKALSGERIFFQIRQINNISFSYYEKEFNYEEIVKIFLLQKNYYDNINKIFQFFDKAVNKNKVSLSQNLEKKTLVLTLKKALDFDEIDCSFDLIEKNITNEEMLKILFNEIREMKLSNNTRNNNNINNNNNKKEDNDKINENNELLKKLIKQNEELEKKMNKIIDENIKLKNNITELESRINNIKEKEEIEENDKNVEEETNFKSQNIEINFYGNPENLEFKDTIANYNTKSGWLRQFVVYTGLLDNIEYLVYCDNKKNNINVITIADKKSIHQFKGHKNAVSVMRYFIQNYKYEYLLSCDESKIVICWDLQQYSQYLKIITNYYGYIWDALILFNIKEKNYIFVPSNNLNEYTKIYEFKDNSPAIKEIFGTKENKTNYLIPWFYKNNYYLIECCNSKISINNIFKDENYADLAKEPEGFHCCGYIYNDNYLCVTDYNNSFLRIWDLPKKTMYKEIELDTSLGLEIIPWNNIYSIIACGGYLVVVDLKQKKTFCKIRCKKNNTNFCGIKKIQISDYGECLLCSDSKHNISLFNLNNI